MAAKAIQMPKMGNTVESVIIGDIFIKIGDQITIGQSLFDYETDKSTTEYNSEVEGEVLAILMEEGEEIKVKSNIIIYGKNGDNLSEFNIKKMPDKIVEVNEIKTEQPKKTEQVIKTQVSSPNFTSPRAKATAKKLSVNISDIIGTGITGRIVEDDVLKYYHADEAQETKFAAPIEEFTKVDFTPTRISIAKAMSSSLHSGSQLTLAMTIDATAILKLRSQIKENYKVIGIANSSINDIFIFALSRVLPKFPHLNATIGEDRKYTNQYNVAHIAVAVDAPKGLITPVVKNASSMTLSEITNTTKELFQKAMLGKLRGKDISGGTFTITNLGLSGVSFFTPIINPPQVAILGVGSPSTRLRFDKDKNIEEYPEIILSFTMDHGPSDGAAGTIFLKEFKKVIENINVLFL